MQMVQEKTAKDIIAQGEQQHEINDINVLILLISRLTQILGKEVDVLEKMDIKTLNELQPEKIALVGALEKQKKLIARRPEILYDLDDEIRDNLAELLHIFDAVAHENHNKLLIAKEVNEMVVAAIMDSTHENLRRGLYNEKGFHAEEKSMAVSLNKVL